MIGISAVIKYLRIYCISLFFFSLTAILGSLILHNILVGFKFQSSVYPLNLKSGTKIVCNNSNNFCSDFLDKNIFSKSLDECNIKEKFSGIFFNGKLYTKLEEIKKFNITKEDIEEASETNNFYVKVFKNKDNTINKSCIKNSKNYKLYKILPIPFELISNLRSNNKYSAGTERSINPFIYGESSISNIAKRFPVNYLFKSFLYLSCVLIFFYWRSNNKILNILSKSNNYNIFLLFGYASGVFLFLHVFLLGQTFDLKVLMLLKKIIIVFFILAEILAQFFLLKTIKSNLSIYKPYIFEKILRIKLILIYLIILTSFVVILILATRDMTKEFDYILEWNYFVALLFFYFLSFLLWKKNY
tara:strand:+ start:86 stop:1162 length:1077 start_codon:yes stop_codon:yes gene_type:complete